MCVFAHADLQYGRSLDDYTMTSPLRISLRSRPMDPATLTSARVIVLAACSLRRGCLLRAVLACARHTPVCANE